MAGTVVETSISTSVVPAARSGTAPKNELDDEPQLLVPIKGTCSEASQVTFAWSTIVPLSVLPATALTLLLGMMDANPPVPELIAKEEFLP